VNWLVEHDRAVQELEPAPSFNDYSYFDLTRYPRLRPFPPKDLRQRRLFEISRGSVLFQIAEQQALLPVRTTESLNSGQTGQLAALVIDLRNDAEVNETYGKESTQWRIVGKKGPQQQARLTKQVKKAQQELHKLHNLAGKAIPVLGRRYLLAADRCLKDLGDHCEPIPDDQLRQQLSIHQPEDDQSSFAVVPLYWFFRHECGLSGNESEVRAAMIRNQFLTAPGKEPLKYQAESTGGEFGGSSAVRLAVNRYRPEAQTP